MKPGVIIFQLNRRLIVTAIVLIGFSKQVSAQTYEVLSLKSFPIYKTQELKKSQRLKILQPGQRALISPKKYGEWRKLLITSEDGSLVKGWAHIRHLRGRTQLRKIQSPEPGSILDGIESQLQQEPPEPEKKYSQSVALGGSFHTSYLSWGKRSFTLSDDTEWSVSEVTSTTFWPSLFLDLTMGSRSAMRLYLGYRTAKFEGESTTDFPIGTKQTSFIHTFLAMGLVYKWYRPNRLTWWGLGAEFAQGQELKIAYDNTEIPLGDEDLPLFILLFLSGGYDFRITETLYLLPELRIGTVYNQDPKIYFAEGLISLGWRL
jgi:hypothetical protein